MKITLPAVLVLLLALFSLVVPTGAAAPEEPDLKKRFGADYCAYHAVTPRWFPSRTAPGQPDSPNQPDSPKQADQADPD